MKIIFETGGPNPFKNTKKLITVYQSENKKKLFTVIYGLQVEDNLTYDQCCTVLGSAVLHMQCCEGIASNDGL